MKERRRFFDVDAARESVITGFVSGADKEGVGTLRRMPKDNHAMVELLLLVYKLGRVDAQGQMLEALGLEVWAGEVRRSG